MTASLHSDNWYRVAPLRPRLRSHVEVQRRDCRSGVWYVLRDTSSGRHHRVNASAYHIVGRLDGNCTVQQAWEVAHVRLGVAAPTQDEVITLLASLHEAHLIQTQITPDVDDLFQRRDARARRARAATLNPLSFKLPLFDPLPFLDRWANLVAPVYTRAGLALWVVTVTLGVTALLPRWAEVVAHGARLLEVRQLLLLALVYPVIKAWHELGHAFAVRVWGGEVREMGVALMLFIPVPYVDASAASGFRERHRRVAVSAAGIMMELFLAAVAALLWVSVEEGLVRDLAFTVMAIGGVSTVLFNGNPLMRLDGYYVLSDALEIQNLGSRANQFCLTWVQRTLLRADQVRLPATDAFERWFLPLYGIAAAVYRVGISVLVLLWVATKSVLLAAVLGAWMACVLVLLPARRVLAFLLNSSLLHGRRGLAMRNALLLCAALAAVVLLLPFPSASTAQGVVWFPESAQIRAPASGFVQSVHAVDGDMVQAGAALVDLDNPGLRARLQQREARLQMLHTRLRQAMRERATELQAAAQEVAAAETELTDLRSRVAGLTVSARASGRLILPRGDDLPGSFVKQGATLGHIVTDEDMVVRVAVTQDQAARIREGFTEVAVRLVEHPAGILPGRVIREVPAADTHLPSAALGDRGGGAIRTDPADKDGVRTLQPVYYFDLRIAGEKPARVGGRSLVRFQHAAEPVGGQALRALRQLFLKRVEA